MLDAPPFFFFLSRVYGKVESRIHVLMQNPALISVLSIIVGKVLEATYMYISQDSASAATRIRRGGMDG